MPAAHFSFSVTTCPAITVLWADCASVKLNHHWQVLHADDSSIFPLSTWLFAKSSPFLLTEHKSLMIEIILISKSIFLNRMCLLYLSGISPLHVLERKNYNE